MIVWLVYQFLMAALRDRFSLSAYHVKVHFFTYTYFSTDEKQNYAIQPASEGWVGEQLNQQLPLMVFTTLVIIYVESYISYLKATEIFLGHARTVMYFCRAYWRRRCVYLTTTFPKLKKYFDQFGWSTRSLSVSLILMINFAWVR